jgi:HK97 family phage major capsid protein
MPIMIDNVINSIEVELEQAVKTRDKAIGEIKYILAQASQNGQANLSREDSERVDDLFKVRDKSKADIAGIEAKLEQARRAKADELEVAELQRESRETGVPRPGHDRQRASVTVGREERTYRSDTDRKGSLFLRDVARAFMFQDAESQHRLSQHMAEERVERGQYLQRAAGDTTTGNFAGLTVPQYLTDMYAPAVAALRPFADICNHHDLPESGMTINISQITTPTQVNNPPSELPAAVATQTIDDTLLTENVQTAAGSVLLSRQAIDRGTGIEEVTMQDLFRRYATNLDSNLLNQATTGLSALATGTQVVYTAAPGTVTGLYPKILQATSQVEAALLAQAIPSHVIMHSRRWWWLSAELVTSWPLINSQGIPEHAGGVLNPNVGYNGGIRGRLPAGLGVVVDNNVVSNLGGGTNQDEIYVVAKDECHLWEDPNAPVFIRAEQPQATRLGVLLVLYGYYAYTLRRYAGAVQSVGGTGLSTPTF